MNTPTPQPNPPAPKSYEVEFLDAVGKPQLEIFTGSNMYEVISAFQVQTNLSTAAIFRIELQGHSIPSQPAQSAI